MSLLFSRSLRSRSRAASRPTQRGSHRRTRALNLEPLEQRQLLTAAPSITNAVLAVEFQENSTANVLTVTADDGDAGETQELTFSISGGDDFLFDIDSTTGVLTFLAVPDYEDPLDLDLDNVYEVEVTVTDTADDLTATATFQITVTDVTEDDTEDTNSSPELNLTTPSVTGITEDETDNDGMLISALIGDGITDDDTDAVEGIAITAVSTSGWEFSIDDGVTWGSVGTVSESAALLLRSQDLIRFVPDGENGGEATFIFCAWDQTGDTAGLEGTTTDASDPNGTTSPFSTDSATARITVTGVNDAPVLTTTTTFTLTAVDENDLNSNGTLIKTLVASGISDVDTGAAKGIAITALNTAHGTWQYTTDGGDTWTSLTAPTSGNAFPLAADDETAIRFLPATDYDGDIAEAITFHAWDQTTGTSGQPVALPTSLGGTTAFSEDSDTASITVTPANSAPVLDETVTFALAAISEDDKESDGTLIKTLVASGISDVDTGAVKGIAITALDTTNGTWAYTLNGTTWNALTTPTSGNAFLLAADDTTAIRFVPNDNYNGIVSSGITFRAWDQTTGTSGQPVALPTALGGITAYSTASDTASITVNAANDAPVLAAIETSALAYTENGTAVAITSTLTVNDADSTVLTSATVKITNYKSGQDVLAFTDTTNIKGSFDTTTGILTLTVASGGSGTPANFQTALQAVTYKNTSDDPDTTVRTLTITTNDGDADSNSVTRTLNVTKANDAPVLDTDTAFALDGITEDVTTSTGTLISDLVEDGITDADSDAETGIAISAISTTYGTWQYTLDGTTWKTLSAPASGKAVVLAADTNTRIRFVPTDDYFGTVSSAITFYAWDQTDDADEGDTVTLPTTKGGTTAYSSSSDTATITVTNVNDAPTLDDIDDPEPLAANAAQQTVSLTGISAGPNSETGTVTVTVASSNTTLVPAANLTVSYTSGASTGTVKFTPAANQIGTAVITVTVTDSDNLTISKTFTITVGDASISGYSYIDRDNDGEHDSGETGIPNALLTLQRLVDNSYIDVQVTTSGDDGSFAFSNLPAGTYKIIESHPANFRDGQEKAGTAGGTVADGSITGIVLDESEDATGYYFGERGLKLGMITLGLFLNTTPAAEEVIADYIGTSTLSVTGTSSADTIEFTAGSDYHTLKINGSTRKIAATVDSIMLDTGAGDDTVTLNGTSGADTAKVWKLSGTTWTNWAKLKGTSYDIEVTAAETLNIDGKGGSDTATVNGNTAVDELTADDESVKVTSDDDYVAELFAFETVKAISNGGSDTKDVADALDYVLTFEGTWTDASDD